MARSPARNAATIVSRWVAPPGTTSASAPQTARARSTSPGATPTVTRSATRRIVATRALQQGATAEREPRLGAEAEPLAPSRGEHDPVDGRVAHRPEDCTSLGSGAPAARERTWSLRRSKAPNANRRIAGCCRSRVRTSCQRHVAGSAAAARVLAALDSAARIQDVLGGAVGVPPIREAAEEGLGIAPPALATRARVVERRRHRRRQFAGIRDLVAQVAPSPDDVVIEPGGNRAVARVGHQHDRPVEGEKLEDHAGGVGQEHVAREQVWHDVGVRVFHQVDAAVGGGEARPARHPPRAPVADDRVRLDDDVEAGRLRAHEIDEALAEHGGGGEAEVPRGRIEQGRPAGSSGSAGGGSRRKSGSICG